MRKPLNVLALLLIVFLAATAKVHGQTNLPLNTIVQENFNGMGASATAALPANWRFSPSGNSVGAWSAGAATTTQAANSGLPATGGRYNWVTASGTDRSIGFLTSASYNAPNAVMAYYRNTTGAGVNFVTVGFAVERYVVNTGSFSLSLHYSTDGVSWTALPAGDIAANIFPSGANAAAFTAPLRVNRVATVAIAVPNNGDIYFRWTFNTTNTASQGLGLDDVSVFAGTPTPVMMATLRDILQVDNGIPNQFNAGDVIRYQTVIKNTGTGEANGVQITLPAPPANTTMVPGSIKTSALAVDDQYTTSFNTPLNGSTVLANDAGIPAPAAVIVYGPTNNMVISPGVATVTDAGGSITLAANGSFSYTPPSGFSGVDQFKYLTGNGNLPDNDAIVRITVAPDISFSSNLVNPSCNGGSNGSITITASGGNGVLQYSINGSAGPYQAGAVFTNLAAGTYNLAVRDAGGYIKTGTATLTNPPLLVVSGTIPTLTYSTSMTPETFTKTGGTGSVTWSASGLPGGVTIDASSGQVSGTPSATGVFTALITATDANGCTGTRSQSVNVAPRLINDSYTQVVGNTQMVADGHTAPTTPFTTNATNILTNDASNVAITVTAGTFATSGGGSITIAGDGKFTYTPPLGSTAADSYSYTATSNGVSATATINFSIANVVWYIKAGGPAGDGRSNTPRNTLPSGTIGTTGHYIYIQKEVSGTTPGGISLQASQQLIGAGATLTVGLLSITGAAGNTPTLTGTVTLAANINATGFNMNTGTATALTNAGATVTGVTVNVGTVTSTTGSGISLTGTGNSVTMTLASLTVNGAANAINLTNTAGTVTIGGGSLTGGAGAVVNISGGTAGFTYSGSMSQATAAQPLLSIGGGHTTGTVLFQTGTLQATNGTGLQFDNADGIYQFNGTTQLNGGDAGIDILNGSGGTFSFASSTSITNPANEVVRINASSANVTYSGSFSKTNAGTGISVNGSTGGTINFNGTGTKNLSTATGNAINLTGNTGATINFSGNNLSLTTSSGTGFNATGGGTVNLTGTNNTITSTLGTGVNIQTPTNIGSSGFTLRSVNVSNGVAASGANGIVLNGTTGTFIVTGDGTLARNGSGGTIDRTTGDGIVLTNASNVTLQSINLTNNGDATFPGTADNESATGEHAVEAIGGGNIVMSGCLIQNPKGSGVVALNLTGTNRINNNSLITDIDNPSTHGLFIRNSTANLTLFEVNQTNFTNSSTGTSMVNFKNEGAANMAIEIKNGIFEALDNQAITGDAGATTGTTGTVTSLIQGNTFRNAVASSAGGVNISSENNVAALVANGALHNATIENNLFDNVAEDGRVANTSVIRTQNSGGRLQVTVKGNTIQNINFQTGAGGRHVIGHVFEPAAYNAANFSNIRIENNTATNITFTATNREFIFIDYREFASGGDIKILNNNWNMPTGAATSEAIEIRLHQANTSTVNVQVDNNGQGSGAISNTSTRFLRIDVEESVTGNITITNNRFTNTSATPGAAIEVRTEDNAAAGSNAFACLNISGNNLTAAGNNIALNEGAATTLNVSQASSAAVTANNNGAAVTITGAVAFGGPICSLPLN